MIELNEQDLQLISGGDVTVGGVTIVGYPSSDPGFTVDSPYPGDAKIIM